MTINSFRWLVTAVIFGIGLNSCASSPGQTRYYLLAVPVPQSDPVTTGAMVNVEPITMPTYLDRMGIVLVSADRQVQVANYHLWAEPLNESIAKILHDQLLGSLAAGTADLNIEILFFHGNPEGLVVLDVNWKAKLSCGETISARYRENLQQPASGYLALVETHALMLENLASEIGTVVDRQSTCSG